MCLEPCQALEHTSLNPPCKCRNPSLCYPRPQVTPQNLYSILHKAPSIPHSVLRPHITFSSRQPPLHPVEVRAPPEQTPQVTAPPPEMHHHLTLRKNGLPKDTLPLKPLQAFAPTVRRPLGLERGVGVSLSCSLPLPDLLSFSLPYEHSPLTPTSSDEMTQYPSSVPPTTVDHSVISPCF